METKSDIRAKMTWFKKLWRTGPTRDLASLPPGPERRQWEYLFARILVGILADLSPEDQERLVQEQEQRNLTIIAAELRKHLK